MSRAIPTVQRYMTPAPCVIGPSATLAEAHRLMREHAIRHLPVVSGAKLVGIVTERDLHLVETLRDVRPDEVLVSEAMTQSTYMVAPEAPLDDVVATMAERKYGSAVVMRHRDVVGMLTTVDVCRALAALLREDAPQ